MASVDEDDVVRRAKAIYEQRLRANLEATHRGEFVCIEPDSGDHFVGPSLVEVVRAARRAHPDRITYTVRIGFPVVVEIGTTSC